ncbi:hypothetical protein [Mycobacterium sp. 1274756.6]|uniref:hypothetical protein n=1 Tax=Mycobacterium sp. 1274756.6 TaxID=1834076 RepID=UPI0007FE696C|nr:hypothetical protein [Mycobacterium sp. 1274756.6]OBJ73377.1 hypothetical protein A5643_03720 [Mycobacterium sp. 1274756.6]
MAFTVYLNEPKRPNEPEVPADRYQSDAIYHFHEGGVLGVRRRSGAMTYYAPYRWLSIQADPGHGPGQISG